MDLCSIPAIESGSISKRKRVKHRLPSAVAEFSRQVEHALKAVVGKLAFNNH
jgi:hypothetical protein